MQKDLTKGSVLRVLLLFSFPYLVSCFLQTFYGMADLFITGQFNGEEAISAVSIGSQVMHMLTVIIVGLAMGSTVLISRSVGEKNQDRIGKAVGNSITIFMVFSLVLTVIFLCCTDGIIRLISVPAEAVEQTKIYLLICFAGIPFITAYNIVSCIYRGMGDSRSPLYFIAAACVLNLALDYVFIGGMHLGAAGAALGTVLSQTASVAIALIAVRKKSFGISLGKKALVPDKKICGDIFRVGIPVAFQDGLIQVSFIIITIIANRRGVTVAASVGIVEKMICFFFLVPSAMLSSVSAITAQNIGAQKEERGLRTLQYGIGISVSFGVLIAVICQFLSPQLVGLFTDSEGVVRMGAQYLRSYSMDCFLAAIHFCFSGYFCAYGHSGISFLQNLISIILLRVPGAYLASLWYPDTLYPMGLAAPAGSLLSAVICVIFFVVMRRTKGEFGAKTASV